MSIKIKFLGAVRTVTGSMHLISNGDSKIVMDCGLFQGHREEYYTRNSHFPFDPGEIDACILSHAHIDHSGNIPNFVKHGFRSRILTTSATRDLCSSMLPDSGHIQEEDIKYLNKINKRKGLPAREPLYTRIDAEESLQYFDGHPYEQKITIKDESHFSLKGSEADPAVGAAIHKSELPADDIQDVGDYVMSIKVQANR